MNKLIKPNTIIVVLIAFLNWTSIIAQSAIKDWQQVQVDVVYLASDDLEGRETGSAGEHLASSYIAMRYNESGLKPMGTNSWYYTFDYATNPHEKEKKDGKGTNVIGLLDLGKEKTIIIGAHYDHLGHGISGSLAPNSHEIHNGADDNASGVSSLLWLAENLKDAKELKYNIMFIAFSGEELGLIGSKAYAESPTMPIDKIAAMINMDMVGRLNKTKTISISGTGTAKEWKEILDEIKPTDFTFNYSESGVGPSDHTSFYLKNIPVLHFFTGQHSDYHKPSDDSPLVNYPGIVEVSKIILNTILKMNGKENLNFQKTKDENKEQSASFKVTMGVMPDYVYSGKGMRIDAVMENRPASKAGIQNGDVVIKVGDLEIKDVYDYMKALNKYNKGEKAEVIVERKGKKKKYEVEF